MHYYIDGYNLMFRYSSDEEEFQQQRQALIESLNEKVQYLQIHVTIVFDAHYQAGESSRSHFNHLEILFSAEGQTADEAILEEIRKEPLPHRATVVTSDKKLAWFARRCSAKTESVEHFMTWLIQRYQNKQRRQKLEGVAPLARKLKTKAVKPPVAAPPIQDDFSYYLETFEKEFASLEPLHVEKPPRSPSDKKVKKTPKSKPQKTALGDLKRWEQIFNKKLAEDE